MSKWLLWNDSANFSLGPIEISFASMPVSESGTIYGTVDNPYEKIKFLSTTNSYNVNVRNLYGYYWHPDRDSQSNLKEVILTSESRLFRILSSTQLSLDPSYATQCETSMISGSFKYDESKSSLPENFPKRVFIGVKFKATLESNENEEKYIGVQITDDKIYFIKENLSKDIAAGVNNLTLQGVQIENIDFHVKEQEVPTFFADLFLTQEKKIFKPDEQFAQRKNVILTQEINGVQVAVFPKTYVSGLMNDDGTSWKEPEANFKLRRDYLDGKNVLKNIRIKGEVFKAPSLADNSEEIEFY